MKSSNAHVISSCSATSQPSADLASEIVSKCHVGPSQLLPSVLRRNLTRLPRQLTLPSLNRHRATSPPLISNTSASGNDTRAMLPAAAGLSLPSASHIGGGPSPERPPGPRSPAGAYVPATSW